MLMRTDPFRDFDRAVAQLLGAAPRPAGQPSSMPVDAWREGDAFFIALDLPGVDAERIDLDVERNVLSVRAERAPIQAEETVAAERHHGVFARQFILGENLDTDSIAASYESGVLTLRIPIAEKAKARKISVTTGTHPVVAVDARSDAPSIG